MRTYQLSAFGCDNLQLVEQPTPQPGPGEVQVRMRAASINYRDFMIAEGFYNPKLNLPLQPLSDGAGEVAAVGEGVTQLRVGQRVSSLFWPQWVEGPATWPIRSASTGCELPGVLTERWVVPETAVCPIPDYMSFAEAASLPCAALTAWTGLRLGNTGEGDWVLAQGTGGVSIFALQLASALGARVAVISSSDEKLARARELGAEVTLNYKQEPNWGAKIAELTGGGVNNVIEIGGAGTLTESMQALALNGSIALIGALAGFSQELNLMGLVGKNAHTHGVTVGNRADYEDMLALMAEQQIHPVISKTYAFDNAGAALRDIAGGKHFGKLVIEMD